MNADLHTQELTTNQASNSSGINYDLVIVGGGLAGLALSILIARKGHKTLLIEKEHYPFHKVCGEYISMESWDFLNELGLDPDALHVSHISKLIVSAVNGKSIKQKLVPGGFGISRYVLDEQLMKIAKANGVVIKEGLKVNDITFREKAFLVETSQDTFHATVVGACYGKRSNMDVKWKRPFAEAAKNKLNNYVGIKYHIRGRFDEDTIALHNFHNGYCGLVKIEEDKYNLCYLTTASNLQHCKGSITEMEETILSQNPYLKNIFVSCEKLNEPITVSQISFDRKKAIENHILMIGDAAGMIAPLCGNGMSMALHGAKIAAAQIDLFLNDAISREMMERRYIELWKKEFSKRLKMGRMIQRVFGGRTVTNAFVGIAKIFPGMVNYLVRQTHGNSF